jgi:glycosyltransferase involved in cell wall biosynthesis
MAGVRGWTVLYMVGRKVCRLMDLLVVSRGSAVFGPSRGGADTLALRHAQLMGRMGLQVGFVGVPGMGSDASVTVTPITQKDVLDYRVGHPRAIALSYMVNQLVRLVATTRAGLRLVRERHPHLVLSNASLTTIVLRLRHPNTPVVYYLHDGLFTHRSGRGIVDRLIRFIWNDVMERVAVKCATHVFCASEGIAEELRGQGVPPGKLSVMVPAPARPGERGPDRSPSAPLVGQSTIADPFLLSVGQQSGRKRFDLLVEAMQYLPDSTHLVVVGNGPYHSEYVRLAQQDARPNRIHLMTDVSDAELRRLYSGAGLYVLVSENEGFPVTVAEALAAGCPSLLVSPSASPPDWTENGQLTLLSTIPSAPELAEQLKSLWTRVAPVRRRVTDPSRDRKAEAVAADRVETTIFQHYVRLISQWEGRSAHSFADRHRLDQLDQRQEPG